MRSIFQSIFLYFFYNSWPVFNLPARKGYSVLLPLPGDLPVFLKFTFDWLKLQKRDNLVEILVIPDRLTKDFSQAFKETRSENRHLPMRLAPLTSLDRLTNRIALSLKDVYKTHPLQIVRAINNLSSEHALLSDADVFMIDKNFIERQYKICLEKDLFCLGADKAWDNWFEENNIKHIVSTWQLMFRTAWVRRFRPFQIFPGRTRIGGKRHNLDVFYLVQYLTSPEKISNNNCDTDFVHLGNIILTYNKFRVSRGPFEDSSCKILFIRMLADAYNCVHAGRCIPDMQELIKGIKDPQVKVTYLDKNIPANYLKFRNKMQRIIDSGILSDEKIKKIKSSLELFDENICNRYHIAVSR